MWRDEESVIYRWGRWPRNGRCACVSTRVGRLRDRSSIQRHIDGLDGAFRRIHSFCCLGVRVYLRHQIGLALGTAVRA